MPLKMQSDITNVVFVATLLTEKTKVHMSKKVGIRDHSGLIFPLELSESTARTQDSSYCFKADLSGNTDVAQSGSNVTFS